MISKADSENPEQSRDTDVKAASGSGPAPPLYRFLFLKPTLAILLIVLFVGAGVLAYLSMVKESMPDLGIPQATVQTEWAGADPETIEKEVTNKIEKKLKSLKGLKRLRSASFDSYSVIAVEFRAEADLGESLQLLRDKVRDAEPELPSSVEKPKIEQMSVDDTPFLTVALFGEVDQAVLSRLADALKERLEKIPGIRKVDLGGTRKEVIHIQLIPSRILALGIPPTLVKQRVQQANIDMPWGRFENEVSSLSFRLYGKFREVSDLENLPVLRLGNGQGRVVRLSEIARIRRDLEREKSIVSVSWKGSPFKPCVDLSMIKSPGSDTIRLVENSLELIKDFQRSVEWPYGVSYEVTSDQSVSIWDRLNEVFNNGWQAMLAVFAILFVMLTWREALVAGLSIPITFLGALLVLWAMGYTMNEVVIIGMVLALGLLVDVFILMMEGMHEGIFVEGLDFERTAMKTIRTYSMPAFVGQLTTILAMVPLFAIGGMDGKFIRIIPVTAIICLVLSFIIALFVDIPLSRSLLGRVKAGQRKTRVDAISENLSKRLNDWSLRTTVRNRKTALVWVLGAFALFLLSVFAVGLLPSQLYPKTDGRKLGITVELAPDSTLERSKQAAADMGAILRRKPFFETVVQFVGKKSPLSQNSIGEALTPSEDSYLVGFSCIFTPLKERDKPAFQYLDDLRAELKTALRPYPGALLVFTPETGGSSTEDPIQIEIAGDDMGVLRELSKQTQNVLSGIRGSTDIRDNLGATRSSVRLIPKREALDFFQISQDEIAEQVRFVMTDDEIGKFPLSGMDQDLEIRLSTSWPSRGGFVGGPTQWVELPFVQAYQKDGGPVPLMSLLDVAVGETPLCITHKNGLRSVVVLGKTRDRTVGEILGEAEPALQSKRSAWPAGYDYHFGGEAESSAETYASAGKMFLVAIFLVFAVLALLFGSFTQPFIIMLSVPFAMIGTLGGFFLFWIPFSFPAVIGIIALVGIVVNDAIVMVDTMNTHRKNGLSVRESAARGAADRLRPIVSTTVTTVVGLTPLALSSPMWMPLCAAIIFGLISATLVSQLVIPCLLVVLTPER